MKIKNWNKFNENSKVGGMKRSTTEIEQEVMEYLNDLRESGITNMYGAVPYILDNNDFDLDKKEASRILSLWMENFNEEGDYNFVKVKED